MRFTAIEFFSGMGSFSEACRELTVDVLAAFDQSQLANKVFKHNFDLKPCPGNLDSLPAERIPPADIWWMSPPCTPYSRRGRRADAHDPRAQSFFHLLHLLPEKLPHLIIVENVVGFKGTEAEGRLDQTLKENGYVFADVDLCSTLFGVPMRRPRHFVIALRTAACGGQGASSMPSACLGDVLRLMPPAVPIVPLGSFVDSEFRKNLLVPDEEATLLKQSTHLIDPNDPEAIAICFTKNYYRCRQSSGSLLESPDGQLRRFSAAEMLRLFGFSPVYSFPEDVTEEDATRLLGNAVDVRTIKHLLRLTLPLMLETQQESSLLNNSHRQSVLLPDLKEASTVLVESG